MKQLTLQANSKKGGDLSTHSSNSYILTNRNKSTVSSSTQIKGGPGGLVDFQNQTKFAHFANLCCQVKMNMFLVYLL